jgi:hypothetical protein
MAITIATTHTKVLIAPSTGVLDKVYGADYVDPASHTSTLTGLGTGVETALGVSVGSAGSVIVNGGDLGTPSAGVATNLTGTAAGLTAGTASAVAVGGITGLGTGVATALAVNVGSAGAFVTFNGAGGTPSSMVGTNITGTAAGLTAGSASAVAVGGITGLGTGVATALAVNVGTAGAFVVNGGALGTPSSGVATNLTGTAAGLTAGTASAVAVGGITGLGTGVATALAVNVGTAGAFVVNGGALGTPSSGTLTSATGLPIATGLSGLTADCVLVASSSTAVATTSALKFGPAAGQGITAALGTATTDVGNRYTQTLNNAGVSFTYEQHVISDSASANVVVLEYKYGAPASEVAIFSMIPGFITFTDPANADNFLQFGCAEGIAALGSNNDLSLGAGEDSDVVFLSPAVLPAYTVATLPTSVEGACAYVTDQLTTPAAKGVAPTGGGSVKCPVFRNASGWVGM